jgi:hypothetical protein
MLLSCFGGPGAAQEAKKTPADELRAGKSLIATPVFSEEEARMILDLFQGLRVPDVADGLDAAGLQGIGLMDPEIRPPWKDTRHYRHRFAGIAVTARHVPTLQPPAGKVSVEECDKRASSWYRDRSGEPFDPFLRPGSALAIEEAPATDVGTIGSNNILAWKLRGCVGVVAGATARDADEIITPRPSRSTTPARGAASGRAATRSSPSTDPSSAAGCSSSPATSS